MTPSPEDDTTPATSNTASSAFKSSKLTIQTTTSTTGPNNNIPTSTSVVKQTFHEEEGEGEEKKSELAEEYYKTTAYYNDLSGRTRVNIKLKLTCMDEENVQCLLKSGCVAPAPPSKNSENDEDGEDEDEIESTSGTTTTKSELRFECQPVRGYTSSSLIAIEGVSILSTTVENDAILFDTEIIVRAAPPARGQHHHHQQQHQMTSWNSFRNKHGISSRSNASGAGAGAGAGAGGGYMSSAIEEGYDEDNDSASFPPPTSPTNGVQLEIRAVLSEQKCRSTLSQVNDVIHQNDDDEGLYPPPPLVNDAVSLGLLALEIGGSCLDPPPPLPSATSHEDSEEETEEESSARMHYDTDLLYTSPPCSLSLHLVDALEVSVQEVGSARSASGATLVALTVAHSNVHNEDVTVTNIALHPGHSRLLTPLPMPPSSMPGNVRGGRQQQQFQQQQGGVYGDDRTVTTTSSTAMSSSDSVSSRSNMRGGGGHNVTGTSTRSLNSNRLHTASQSPVGPATVEGWSMQGGELSVIDMSRKVKWGYANGTAPSLPYVLKPYEAFATVIQIDAAEDMRSRPFVSPVAVTAVVGTTTTKKDEDKEKKKEEGGMTATHKPLVVVATDARWTTARLAVEPSDAFKVDMSLQESRCVVGAPLVVSLKVLNLSNETRDLMLLMAKDEESSSGGRDGGGGGSAPSSGASVISIRSSKGYRSNQQQQPHGVNTAVVSEVNGYTFGVWGLSGDDDGTTRHNRDHELLAVDAALLLGEVKGQHTIEAELRFVPLREGTLDVPNLKLYDKMGGKWYNCVHLLKIVVAAKA